MDIPLSKDSTVQAATHVQLVAIHSWCRSSSIPVPKKGGAVFRLTLQAFLKYKWRSRLIRVSGITGDRNGDGRKSSSSGGHERGLTDEKSRHDPQIVAVSVREEGDEVCESADMGAVNYAKVELVNKKVAMHYLEKWASAETSLMLSGVGGRHDAQTQLMTILMKFQSAERPITAGFEQLRE